MPLARCFDAAFPPSTPPPNALAALGYVGSDFPDPARLDRDYHIWSPAEWLPFKELRQFPVWECDPSQDPRASAQNAVGEMRELGWNIGRALVMAMETFIEPRWWAVCESEIEVLGQFPVCYGSESTVYQNHPKFVWLALYDGVPSIPVTSPPTLAKQYLSLASLDWSVVSGELMARGGIGPRNQRA